MRPMLYVLSARHVGRQFYDDRLVYHSIARGFWHQPHQRERGRQRIEHGHLDHARHAGHLRGRRHLARFRSLSATATYNIYNGGTKLGSVTVNQKTSPAAFPTKGSTGSRWALSRSPARSSA